MASEDIPIDQQDQTLWNFVRLQPKFKQVNHLMYYFEYAGVMCAGVVTRTPFNDHLRIMPFNVYNDIGSGCGITVFKTFKRDDITEVSDQPSTNVNNNTK